MYNIILCSPPHQTQFFGVSADTIFTTCITIFIFLLGYIVTRLIQTSSESKRLNELKIYYTLLVRDLLKPISDYQVQIEELSLQISDKSQGDINFQAPKGLYFDHINKINQQDLFKIFVSRNRKLKNQRFEEYKNLQDNIEYLKTIPKDLKESFQAYIDKSQKYLQNWNDSIDFIGRQFDKYMFAIRNSDKKPTDDPFFHGMDKLTHTWSKKEDYRNLYIAIESFINPLKELLKKYPTDPRTIELMPAIIKCKSAFENLTGLKKFYSATFDNLSKSLEDIGNKIESSLNFFSK